MPSQTDNFISIAQSADPHYLWNEIVRWTFEACILRKEGRERKVAELLQERLPALIRSWSSRCGLPPEACKQQLRSLFTRAQESVELGFIQRRLIVDEVCARLGRDPQAEAEFEMMGDAVLPVRTAISPSPRHFAEEPAASVALCA